MLIRPRAHSVRYLILGSTSQERGHRGDARIENNSRPNISPIQLNFSILPVYDS